MDRVRLWDKCNAIAAGCVAHGMAPTIPRVGQLYGVAQHETECGESNGWKGEYNYGATTRRSLTPAEQAKLARAGIVPVLSPPAARVASEHAASDLLGLGPGSDIAIHVDSRPIVDHAMAPLGHHAGAFAAILGPGGDSDPTVKRRTLTYFTGFARFADDYAGALYFVGFFRTAREKAALDGQSPEALARAMYAAKYYTGFLTGDPEGNIAAYTKAIAPIFASAVTGLQGWTPGADAPHVSEPAGPPATIDPSTPRGLQLALNASGAFPRLVVDGILGARTQAAIRAFQVAHGLTPDGIAGPATLAALRAAVG